MDEKENAQTFGRRQIVGSLDREFARLHLRSVALIESTSTETLYAIPSVKGNCSTPSVGESVLRSAAVVEQTFGGITSNLWDDPFEWTLPEYLSTPAKLIAHLAEVEAMRGRAFSSFTDDACLSKDVATPANETRSLVELLLETLVSASTYQGQAIAAARILSGIAPRGFII